MNLQELLYQVPYTTHESFTNDLAKQERIGDKSTTVKDKVKRFVYL